MKRSEIYKCAECGLTFEVTTGCNCPVSCCGKEMKQMQAQTADYKQEKHVPFPESVNGGMRVTVGREMPHPMLEAHHIEWIEVINGPYVNRRYLKPGEEPPGGLLCAASERHDRPRILQPSRTVGIRGRITRPERNLWKTI